MPLNSRQSQQLNQVASKKNTKLLTEKPRVEDIERCLQDKKDLNGI